MFFLYFFLANLLVVLSNFRVFYFLTHPNPNWYYYLQHNYYIHDYTLYLSAITQGAHGAWLFKDPYTAETTSRGIFYIFYILIGKIGGLSNLESPIIYHLARILSVELFIILSFILAQLVLGKRLAVFGALFSHLSTISPLMLSKSIGNYPIFIPWWWDFLESLERLNGIPHYVFGQALLLASLILIIQFWQKRQFKYAIFAALIIFIGVIILPSIAAAIIFTLPFTYIFITFNQSLRAKRIILDKFIVAGLFLVVIFTLSGIFIIRLQETYGFPWNIWTNWNVARWNQNEPNFNRDLSSSFALLILLSLPAIFKYFRSPNWMGVLIVFWAATPFLMLPIANLAAIPKIRLIQTAPFVPFGLLIATTIFSISPKYLSRFWKYGLLITFIFSTLAVTIYFFKLRIENVKNTWGHMIPRSGFAAIKFIDINIPQNQTFLAEYMGLTIAAYTPEIVYFGHPSLTYDAEEKHKNLIRFYKQEMESAEAQEFLKQNKINYVYLGLDERKLTAGSLNYNFLSPIYDNKEVVIYKVD